MLILQYIESIGFYEHITLTRVLQWHSTMEFREKLSDDKACKALLTWVPIKPVLNSLHYEATMWSLYWKLKMYETRK